MSGLSWSGYGTPAGGLARRGCAGRYFRRGETQLVGKNTWFHQLDAAALQIAKLERSIGHTDQPADLMAKMLHDPAYLAVLALSDGDVEPGVAWHLAVEAGVDLAIADLSLIHI